MNNVMITGGTGFVGSWMRQTKPERMAFNCLSRKMYDKVRWEELRFDYVVHLAPVAPTSAIACAKRNRARLLYCSSGIVDHPEWDTQYRRDKMRWEAECLDSGVDVVIARLFAFAESSKAWLAFNEAAKNSKPLIITGDGTTTRSYMEGWELGFWMWTILLHGDNGEVYDVGDEKPVTMLELAWKMIQRHYTSSQIVIQGGKDPMPYYMPKDMMKTKGLAKRWIKSVVE